VTTSGFDKYCSTSSIMRSNLPTKGRFP
jgi:hypothetical protein